MRSGTWILAVCGTVGLAISAGIAQDRLRANDRDSINDPSPNRSVQYLPGTDREQNAETETSRRYPFASTTTRGTDLQKSAYGTIPSRYRRSTESPGSRTLQTEKATTPQVPNYHKELFGSERPASTTGTDRSQSNVSSLPALPGFNRTTTYDNLRTNQFRRNASTGTSLQSNQRSTSPFRTASSRTSYPEDSSTATDNSENSSSERTGRLIQADFQRPPGFQSRNTIQQVQRTATRDFNFGSSSSSNDFEIQLPEPEDTQSRYEWPAGTQSVPANSALDTRIPENERATPTGANSAKSPMVTVQWVKRSRIHVGRECAFDLVVKNSGKVTAADVNVNAFFPASVRLTKAEPQPLEKQDHLSWEFNSLDPNEEKIIQIGLIPSKRGELATQAFVRYTGASESLFTVEEPLLQLTMKGPQEVMVGDPASQTILVSNPGTGIASNVSIEAVIPAGLEHPRGERLVMEIGALNPGESRSVRLALAAATGGQHTIQVKATADDNLRRATTSDVSVIAPSIEVEIDGPALRYLGRNATYNLDVSNYGSAASNNVRVTQYIPDGFEFVKADKGGKFDRTKKSVSWFVGRLEPDQSVKLQCELNPKQLGKFEQRVVAVSEQGIKTEESFSTSVDGTASLVLEIVDLDDPVEVGTETAYEVRVLNEGTKAGQNIEVSCELPTGVELTAAKGPTGALVRNGQIVFKSLPSLAPGKTAIYRVHVTGKVEGNHRVRAHLASDSIQKPLTFEELTKFYTD